MQVNNRSNLQLFPRKAVELVIELAAVYVEESPLYFRRALGSSSFLSVVRPYYQCSEV